MSRAVAERRGRRGETFAGWWLRLQGWRIVARRVKTPRGEVDLIARRGRTVLFLEVKWRSTVIERDRAIDDYRLRRVVAAVEAVAHRYLNDGDNPRIDVLLLAPRSWPRHNVNAWQPCSPNVSRLRSRRTVRELPDFRSCRANRDTASARLEECHYASPSRWTRSKASTSPAIRALR
jgi:putative endonuclease